MLKYDSVVVHTSTYLRVQSSNAVILTWLTHMKWLQAHIWPGMLQIYTMPLYVMGLESGKLNCICSIDLYTPKELFILGYLLFYWPVLKNLIDIVVCVLWESIWHISDILSLQHTRSIIFMSNNLFCFFTFFPFLCFYLFHIFNIELEVIFEIIYIKNCSNVSFC